MRRVLAGPGVPALCCPEEHRVSCLDTRGGGLGSEAAGGSHRNGCLWLTAPRPQGCRWL